MVASDARHNKWWMGRCNGCHNLMLVKIGPSGNVLEVVPPASPSQTSDKIPEPMHSDLVEAKKCISHGCLLAAAIMVRRVIQGTCVHQGAPEDKLHKQIDWLLEQRIITAKQKTWTDAVRWLGNHGAHPSKEEVDAGKSPLDKNEVEKALKIAEQFLIVLYVTDGEAQEVIRAVKPSVGGPPSTGG